MRNTNFFGLVIDTLIGSPLAVERTDAVRGDALNASTFPVVILDTACAFGKLHMLVGRPSPLEKEQRTGELPKGPHGLRIQTGQAHWKNLARSLTFSEVTVDDFPSCF